MMHFRFSFSGIAMKSLFLACFFLLRLSNVYSANEKNVYSRSGITPLLPITSGASMTIADQWYSYMLAHPTTWTSTFVVPDASNSLYDAWTNVVLRFDDSKQHYYQYDWDFTINYSIVTYSLNPSTGASINSGTLTNSLTIHYTKTGSYQDKAVMRYPNAFKAALTISSCTLTVHTPSSYTVTYGSLPAAYNDIYLDLEQETTRNYVINSAPVCGTPVVTDHNELEVDWGFVQGAESYDLEWLFIDEPLATLTTASLPYDFKNATRVNTPNQFYNIPLVYPRGILLYRVRGVSRDPADPDLWITGAWSFPYETGTTDDANTAPATLSFRWRKELNGHLPGMNWEYTATYAEDGKRREAFSVYDGSLHPRQNETVRNTDDNLIVAETKYDYTGIGTVQILPVPLATHDGLTFYPNFNAGFDRSSFASNTTIDNPSPMSTSSGAGNYYSSANSATDGFAAYIADAQGYPYSQSRFTTDGTGRIRSTGAMGPDHKLGSDHETKYYYGSPTGQEELDRLFGNEVGDASHYQKNMVVDPNGQVFVSYLDQEGRVIATALAGNVPDNLIALDGRPDDVAHTDVDLLQGRNHLNNDNTAMVSSTTIVCTADNTDYTFNYTLGTDTTCFSCFICETCIYDLEISIRDQDGNAVSGVVINSQSCTPAVAGNPIACTGISTGAYNFTATLDVGTYTVTKTLKLSESSLQAYAAAYADYQKAGEGCVHPKPIHPEPCSYDCHSMCEQQYTIIDENGVTQHIDEYGDLTTDDDHWGELITNCESTCGTTQTTFPDDCSLHLNLMVMDMSRGGQYFDNTPYQYTYDGSGNLIANTSYDQDDWMETNVWANTNSAAWTAADFPKPGGGHITSWAEMRQYWQEGWATRTFTTAYSGHNSLIEYHPEYCSYLHYCGSVSCKDGTIDMSSSNSYDESLYTVTNNTTAATDGYFNPIGFSGSESDIGVVSNNINYINDDYVTVSSGDPYFSCGIEIAACSSTATDDRMLDYLTHFLPVTISSTTYYYSIWYVLDDPDNIHTYGTSTGAPSDVVDYFQMLHGGGSSTPLIGTGPGQITKYEYFRSVYEFYKKLLQYALVPQDCSGHPLTDANQDGFTDLSITGPMTGFQIRYPSNPTFDAWINATPSMLCGHDQSGLADMISDLNGTLTEEADHADGSCSCNNFFQYLANNGLTSSTDAAVAAYINADPATGITTATSSDVNTWRNTICNQDAPPYNSFGSHFPASWLCTTPDDIPQGYDRATCTCENIRNVISQMGLDPNNTSEYDAITAGLNAYLNPSTAITELDWTSWLAECNETSPSLSAMESYDVPAILKCPAAASSDQADVDDALQNAACMQSNLIAAMANAVALFNQQLSDESSPASAQSYLAYTRKNCLNNLAGRETFTVSYTSNEFYYTLYYYDQAATLVKTVPPQGVNPLDASGVDDVQDYRAGATGSSFTIPAHHFITHYKYNSLQQAVYMNSPDGGSTYYFYDKLGRPVASQSDKQAAYTTPASYSYILYDNLSRPVEAGELKTSNTLTDAIARDRDPIMDLATWQGVSASDKTQVVKSYYDEPMSTSVPGFGTSQENLRGRVSSVIHYNGAASAATYSNANHYSYDIHGNVKAMADENTSLADLDEDVKITTYEYDLVSGNMNAVHYQSGYDDEFHHRYEYDADNRLVVAYSSKDQVIWEKEVKYLYYPTGTLAREEIGDRQVQAVDHIYTALGWIKGVNSDTRDPLRDMGRDGTWNTGAGQNGYFAQDAFGYSLRYFDNDYVPIVSAAGSAQSDMTTTGGNIFRNSTYDLYNGNIAAMITALTDHNEARVTVQGRAFRYDQLNRIKRSDAFTDANLVADNDWSSAAHTWDYYESFSYDFNGNITHAARNGINSVAQQMDSLDYWYPYMNTTPVYTNMLDHAYENLSSSADGNYGIDIDHDQASGNYMYEANGNLRSDASEEIDHIDWTPAGKIWKITRTSTCTTKSDLEFIYDATGNRIEKIEKPRSSGASDQVDWTHTYYRRDALGNVLAVYSRTFTHVTGSNYEDHYSGIEQHIYGSGRVGIHEATFDGINIGFSATGFDSEHRFTGTGYSTIVHTTHDLSEAVEYDRTLGLKNYELTNHLGNVLETVSDRKLAVAQTNVLTSNFSSGADGWAALGATVTYDAPNQRLKVDAITIGDGTSQSVTTVAGTHYTISFKLDFTNYAIDASVYDNSSNLLSSSLNLASDGTFTVEFTAVDNNSTVVFSSHATPPTGYHTIFYLDDIYVGVTDRAEHYNADVLRYADYYAFGQTMPGRVGGNLYRYDFNGKETDAESDLQDYGMRIYNAALGKFLSVDPLTSSYPMLTPYQFSSNMPISCIDIDGMEAQQKTVPEITPENPSNNLKVVHVGTGSSPKPINWGAVGAAIIAENVVYLGQTCIDLYGSFNLAHVTFLNAYVETYKKQNNTVTQRQRDIMWGQQWIPYATSNEYPTGYFGYDYALWRIQNGMGQDLDYGIYDSWLQTSYYDKVYGPGNTIQETFTGILQSHHVVPNAMLRGVNPDPCIKDAFTNNPSEFDKAWNRILLPKEIHGNHPYYNTWVQLQWAEYIANMNLDCKDPSAVAKALRAFADKMRDDLQFQIKTHPGMKINDIYKERVIECYGQ